MLFKHERLALTGTTAPYIRHLQLRPYDDRLLTPAAAYWLFAARALVLVMGGVEAFAWGYLGYLFTDYWLRWIVAGFVGSAIFIVVWMIDTSLLTFDRCADEHAAKILNASRKTEAGKYKTWTAVGVRIIVVVASLTITAPYLAQLIFHKEISQWHAREGARRISAAREELSGAYDAKIRAKQDEIDQKQARLEAEVAGTGLSGRHGWGPTALEIQRAIETLRAEHDALVSSKGADLDSFETIVTDWEGNRDELANRYNLILPEAGILANRLALETLRSHPEHRQTELAIKAFLIFIFVGLLLLKVFEPRSVQFYLSDVLQQEYSRYLSGAFDSLLPETEQATANARAMTPQRLYDFLTSVWAPRRLLERKESEQRMRKAAVVEDIATLDGIRRGERETIEMARADLTVKRDLLDQAMDRFHSLLSAIELVKNHVASFGDEWQLMKNGGLSLDARNRAEYSTYINSQLERAQAKLRELEHAEEKECARVERHKAAVAEAERVLREHTEKLHWTEERIRTARMQLLNERWLPDST